MICLEGRINGQVNEWVNLNKVATATYRTTIIDGQFEKLTFIAQNKFISLNFIISLSIGLFITRFFTQLSEKLMDFIANFKLFW